MGESLFPESHQSEEYNALLKKGERICTKCFMVIPKNGECCES